MIETIDVRVNTRRLENRQRVFDIEFQALSQDGYFRKLTIDLAYLNRSALFRIDNDIICNRYEIPIVKREADRLKIGPYNFKVLSIGRLWDYDASICVLDDWPGWLAGWRYGARRWLDRQGYKVIYTLWIWGFAERHNTMTMSWDDVGFVRWFKRTWLK